MNTRKIQLIINIILVILEIAGFILVINELGFETLKYYTEDSNFLQLLSSALFLIYLSLNREFPPWLNTLRYVSVVSTTLTLIIVLTVLSWTTDMGLEYLLFYGPMLYHHTLCPILALISFICLEKHDNLNALHGLVFTLIYGVIMITLNILKMVEGPYPFLLVYKQPVLHSIIWIIIIFTITYLIALILKKK